MLSHALLVCLSQAVTPLPMPPPVATMGPISITSLSDGARAGVAQELTRDGVAIWVDDRLSTAAAPRFLPEDGGWSGNSVWVAKLRGGVVPALVGSALTCDGDGFTDVWSARAAYNGATTVAVYVALGQGVSQVRWIDLTAGRTCGQPLGNPTNLPIDGLSVIAVGSSFFVGWVQGTESVGVWLPTNASPPTSPFTLALGVVPPLAFSAQVTDGGASVWAAWSTPARGPVEISLPALAMTMPMPLLLPPPNPPSPLQDVVPAEGGLVHVYNSDAGLFQVWSNGDLPALVGAPSPASPLLSRLSSTHFLLAAQGSGNASFARALPTQAAAPAGMPLNLPGSPMAIGTSPGSAVLAGLWVLTASAEYRLQGQVITGGVLPLSMTTGVNVAQGLPLQRKPSIAAKADGWLVAWEEVDMQSLGHPVSAKFAAIEPDGGVVSLDEQLLAAVEPLLLSSPRGPVLLDGAPPRRLSLLSRVGNQLLRGTQLGMSGPTSAVVGQQRVVQWSSAAGSTTIYDSANPSITSQWNFVASPVGTRTTRYLVVAGVNAQRLPGFLWFSDSTMGASSSFVTCGTQAVDEVVSVAARDSAGSADVLLVARTGGSQIVLGCSLVGNLLAQSMSTFQTLSSGSTAGDEQGWFALANPPGAIAYVEAPPSAVTFTPHVAELSTHVYEPWVTSGANGARAMVWVSFDDSTAVGASLVKAVVIGPLIDGGTDAGVDGGSLSTDGGVDAGEFIDAGTVADGGMLVDAGTFVDAGVADGGTDGTVEFTSCSCSSGVDGGLLFVAAVLFRRGRRVLGQGDRALRPLKSLN